MSSTFYKEGSVQGGSSQALSLEITAPWSGHVKTVLVHFSSIPLATEDLVIYHQNKNGLVDWQTEIFSDDPKASQLDNYWFSGRVAVRAGDKIQVTYPNSDDITITASITLEES